MSATIFTIEGKKFFCPLDFAEDNRFMVQSRPRSYYVNWDETPNPFVKINQVLANNSNNVLLIDEKILTLYGKDLQIPAERIFAANASENFKTLDGVTALLDFLYQHQITKSETLVVVGGGIIQDVGAFVGACYKRGIRWVHFPTTLLSMCDSCIGGKTGINYQQAKNQIALFSSPAEVTINPHFLKTLPDEALRSGLGEILKLAITGGERFLTAYQSYVKDGEVDQWENYKPLILNALNIKSAVIEADEFEVHHRRSMNYGHTTGHAIEALTNYAIPHGIAVVVGMIIANELSTQNNLLTITEKNHLNKLCLELLDDNVFEILRTLNLDSLLDLLQKDKKVESDQIGFVMLKTLGDIAFLKLSLNPQLAQAVKAALEKVISHEPLLSTS